MILSNKFTFTTPAYENICHDAITQIYNAKNKFISIFVIFTSNLAQVNKREFGFNQRNLVQRRFRQLTSVSRNRFRFSNALQKTATLKGNRFQFLLNRLRSKFSYVPFCLPMRAFKLSEIIKLVDIQTNNV